MVMMHYLTSPGELLSGSLATEASLNLPGISVSLAPPSPEFSMAARPLVDLSVRLGEALARAPDYFAKARLQYDLWAESQKKRRKIKPLTA